MRTLERKKLCLNNGIKVIVKPELMQQNYTGNIIDITPTGLGIQLTTENEDINNLASKPCAVTLISGKLKPIQLRGTIVHESSQLTKLKRIGISLLQSAPSPERKYDLIPVDPKSPPTANSSHPFLYRENLCFKVTHVSSKEIKLVTSLTNKFLLNGMEFELSLHLPFAGSVKIQIEIENISKKEDGFHINASFLKPSLQFHNFISHYLLFCDKSLTPKSLRTLGFRLNTSLTSVFDYASKEDLEEIGQLRHLAYGSNNANVAALNPKDLLDDFDERAQHLVYRTNGRIVAATRLIFNHGKKENTEILGKYQAELNEDIWNHSFLEISKQCVHPDFQKTDLTLSVMNQALRIAYETSHEFVVFTSEACLNNLWSSMGAHIIGPSFELSEHKTVLYPFRALVHDALKNDFAKDLRGFLNYEI